MTTTQDVRPGGRIRTEPGYRLSHMRTLLHVHGVSLGLSQMPRNAPSPFRRVDARLIPSRTPHSLPYQAKPRQRHGGCAFLTTGTSGRGLSILRMHEEGYADGTPARSAVPAYSSALQRVIRRQPDLTARPLGSKLRATRAPTS